MRTRGRAARGSPQDVIDRRPRAAAVAVDGLDPHPDLARRELHVDHEGSPRRRSSTTSPSTRTITRRAPARPDPRRARTRPGTRPAARSPGGDGGGVAAGDSDHRRTVALSWSCRYSRISDLDAFFAAVEELEDRRSEPGRSWSAATLAGGRRRDRELRRAAVRDPLRDELRGGLASLSGRGLPPAEAHPLQAVLPGRLVGGRGGRAARRADRDGRGIPRPRHVLDSFAGARRLAEAVQVAVRGATSLTCSLGVSTSKVVCKIASDRRKPGGITVVPPGPRRRFLAPSRRACSRRRPARRGAAGRGGHLHDRRLAALADVELRAVLPGQVGTASARSRAGDRPARPRARRRADLDLDRGDLRARPQRPDARSTRSSGGWRTTSLRYLHRDGLSARTVTTKLRYTDFSIRSRSTTLPTPIDEPERIGGACVRSFSTGASETARARCVSSASASRV